VTIKTPTWRSVQRRFGAGASLALAPFALSLSLLGCEEEAEVGTANPPPATEKKVEVKKADPKPPPPQYLESDFSETERSRDPFRSFEKAFNEAAKDRIRNQREVVLEEYNVDELKLIAIVGRLRPARAMLVDPKGMGHVVERGQYLGAAEVVRGGASNADYEINWRVDSVRENDIVLVREDPSNPDVPTSTKIVALRPDEAR
jgi:type IV pilus assembly protein PilP